MESTKKNANKFMYNMVLALVSFVITTIFNDFSGMSLQKWIMLLAIIILFISFIIKWFNSHQIIYAVCAVLALISFFYVLSVRPTKTSLFGRPGNGDYHISMEEIANRNSDDVNQINIYDLECKDAYLINADTGTKITNYTVKNNEIVFPNITEGEYELTVHLRDYKLFKEEVVLEAETLLKTIYQNPSNNKYYMIKVNNPIWSEWSEWSEWSDKRPPENEFTEIEMKDNLELDILDYDEIEYYDKNKPIYEKYQIVAKKEITTYPDGSQTVKPLYGTINLLVGYDTSIEYLPINVISDSQPSSSVLYRYRTRRTDSSNQIVIAADQTEISDLLGLGYDFLPNYKKFLSYGSK